MKRLLSILMMVVAMIFVAQPVSAQSRALNKALKNEYKTKMKQFKKEGWTLYAGTRSLDVALLKHYEQIDSKGDKVQEIVGVVSSAKSENLGLDWAAANAANSYARLAGSHVKGRIVNDMAGDIINKEAEFDKFYAAYETMLEKEIKSELQKSFTVQKKNSDGTYRFQTFFLVDEEAASRARIRAWENAMRESEVAQQYATKVSEFIKEGFEITE